MSTGIVSRRFIPLLFPPERPLNRDELEELDCHRLQPVIEALDSGLRSHWMSDGHTRPDLARVWGLHGGLGQGKSTVIQRVRRRLEQGEASEGSGPDVPPVLPRVHGWHWIRVFTQRHGLRRRLEVTLVEASQLAPERLHSNLISRLVVPALLWRALPMAFLTGLALTLLAWGLVILVGWPDVVWAGLNILHTGLSAGLALALIGPLAAFISTSMKREYEAGHFEQAIYRLASWTGSAPDLVILDDLDRASIDQQRAVLRAFVRHTHLLRCPLVVCFDETEFLSSEPNPEEPAELLRKLIQVPLRLPPRSREDAVLLAWGAAKVWHQHNPDRRQWAACLLDPAWVAHLARVMLATESIGPRRAKSLLAEVVITAHSVQGDEQNVSPLDLDDASALLLLAAIAQIQPLLRSDPDHLLTCLESGGDATAWQVWATQPSAGALFKWLEARPRETAHLKALLRMADTMMPSALGWRRLLLGRGAKAPLAAAFAAPVGQPERAAVPEVRLISQTLKERRFYDGLLQVGQALDAIGWGSCGTEQLDLQFNNWLATVAPLPGTDNPALDAPSTGKLEQNEALRLFWPLLASGMSHWQEERRLRCYPLIDRWLARKGGAITPLRARWGREWAVDAAACGGGDDVFWLNRMREAQRIADSATTFVVIKAVRRSGHRLGASLAAAAWRTVLALDLRHVNGNSLSAAMAHGPSIPPCGPDEQQSAVLYRTAALHHWPVPSIPATASRDIVTAIAEHMWHLRAWLKPLPHEAGAGELALVGALDALDRPGSLIAWMFSQQAGRLTLTDWLEAFAPLCARPSATDDWSFGHWGYFRPFAPTPMGPDTLQVQCDQLQKLTGQAWCTALCLLTQGWHAEVAPASLREELWPALLRSVSTELVPDIACSALSLWADTALFAPQVDSDGNPMADETAPYTEESVRFGALTLRMDDAIQWFKALLSAADQADNPPVSAMLRCLQKFDAGIQTSGHAEFCSVARDELQSLPCVQRQNLKLPAPDIL